jgi:V8-like Glu-specific endopeptidase
MGLRRFRSASLALASVTLVAVGVITSPAAGPPTSIRIRSAAFGQTSTVGALFARTVSGQLASHFCTASVVDSPAGDLVITAAHCLDGRTASQVAFVPDYSRGQDPYGAWTVRQIVEDRQWVSSSDPDDDFAFLIVHQPGTKVAVQELTGGEFIGIGESPGRTVQVAGYPNSQDGLISCQNTARGFSATQFEFDCAGFTNGTSGSPLLADMGPFDRVGTVIGVIGGYEHGGRTAAVSYAARFSSRMAVLYRIALAAAGG